VKKAMPTTTTMALSSPLNPSSLTITSQVSALKDESTAISQLTQQHDITNACETSQLSSPNGENSVDIIKATINGNILKNGAVSSLLTAEHSSPKMSLHSPITMGTSSMSSEIDADLNIKSNDMGCLNVVTSSSPTSLSSGVNNNHFLNGNNGHLLMAHSGASLNFQASNSPDSPSWSIGEVENSGFVNYSSTNNGQMHKRPIMSQQPHHGLSPNSSIGRNNASQQQQQYIHYNKNNGNSNNYSAPWSNSGPWQQQQQQMQHQQQLLHQSSSQASVTNWNRGRSVPNLNPLSPHVPHQRKHQTPVQYSMPPSASSSQGLSPNPNSPSKYRRSTSYPGKNQNMHSYQVDPVGGIIEDQAYMSYQVS
jgi:hypothetical protein